MANYLYLPTIPVDYNRYIDVYTNPGYIIDNAVPLYALAPPLISNHLTWETITTFDAGLDAGFLNNRLSMVFDWYNRVTSNMIGKAQTLPSLLGTGVPSSNNAELSTKGFEISLGWRDVLSPQFSYFARVNVGHYKTTILKYNNENGFIDDWYKGKVYGEIWGYTTDKIIQSDADVASMPDQTFLYDTWGPGDIIYKDLNHDGVIDQGARTLDDHGDLSVIGNSTPKFNFGITGGFNWKNFDFSMLWQGVGKRDLMPGMNSEFFWGLTAAPNNSGLFKNGPALDYWRPASEENFLGPNTDSYLPKPYFSSEREKNIQNQSRYLLNAAYIRLKSLQIGYTIPTSISNKILVDKARIYFAGENLLTFSKLPKLYEPETAVASNPGNGGIDLGEIYPITRMFSFGLSVTF